MPVVVERKNRGAPKTTNRGSVNERSRCFLVRVSSDEHALIVLAAKKAKAFTACGWLRSLALQRAAQMPGVDEKAPAPPPKVAWCPVVSEDQE